MAHASNSIQSTKRCFWSARKKAKYISAQPHTLHRCLTTSFFGDRYRIISYPGYDIQGAHFPTDYLVPLYLQRASHGHQFDQMEPLPLRSEL